MANNLKVGDIIKTPGNLDFIYGITHIEEDKADVVIICKTDGQKASHNYFYADNYTQTWYTITPTLKQKRMFVTEIKKQYKAQHISNLDYIECLDRYKDAKRK